MVDAAVAELGPIDILVNNAGTSVRSPFLEQTDDAWQADFDLKVFAHIRLCRLSRYIGDIYRTCAIFSRFHRESHLPPCPAAMTAQQVSEI